jgi:hypothetical protein
MKQSSLLVAALDYLARDWSVFPLCPPDHRGWLPENHKQGCRRFGKQPAMRWEAWQKRRPEPADLHEWWRWNPAFNVGLALGPVSGLMDIDVDGPQEEAFLQRISNGDLPATLAFATGGGGRHLLYAVPPGSPCRTHAPRTGKKPLHLQGAGAYTVMPPSLHVSGRPYAWLDGFRPDQIEVAPAPAWLVLWLAGEEASKEEGKRQTGGVIGCVPYDNRVQRARKYLEKCEPAIEGQGGDARTFKIACKMIHTFGLAVDTALSLMLDVWNPTCQPPWTEAELRHKLVYAVAHPSPAR